MVREKRNGELNRLGPNGGDWTKGKEIACGRDAEHPSCEERKLKEDGRESNNRCALLGVMQNNFQGHRFRSEKSRAGRPGSKKKGAGQPVVKERFAHGRGERGERTSVEGISSSCKKDEDAGAVKTKFAR